MYELIVCFQIVVGSCTAVTACHALHVSRIVATPGLFLLNFVKILYGIFFQVSVDRLQKFKKVMSYLIYQEPVTECFMWNLNEKIDYLH